MVFQSYAVWPHMSVLQNVAYPLKLAGQKRAAREQAALEALSLVQLGALGGRMPHQLSGGQQQRVALARALVMKPRVLLLDEPLSNLDAHLREELRREISQIRASLGVTVVYVTHDQEEALALADRIVVMKDGLIRQAGPPPGVYASPQDPFVGGFIGKANFMHVQIESLAEDITLRLMDGQRAVLPSAVVQVGARSGQASLMVRPEALLLDEAGALQARVESVTYLGDRLEVLAAVGEDRLRLYAALERSPVVGQTVGLRIERAQLFAAAT
jgi:ABC-type Fe3+/spermidine/putrescine transport system ATPase subunit